MFGSLRRRSSLAAVFTVRPDGTLTWEYDDADGAHARMSPAIGFGPV
jgi:hypothetical protein